MKFILRRCYDYGYSNLVKITRRPKTDIWREMNEQSINYKNNLKPLINKKFSYWKPKFFETFFQLGLIKLYLLIFLYVFFFYSHLTRTTQWEDPRKSLAAQAANQHQRSAEQLLSPGNDSGSSTNATSTPTNSPPHIHSTLQGELAYFYKMRVYSG